MIYPTLFKMTSYSLLFIKLLNYLLKLYLSRRDIICSFIQTISAMNIETLENRLCELERLVFGCNKPVRKSTFECEKNLVDQLYELYSAMSVAEKRSVSSKLLSRINEIQKYIDPNFMEDDILLTKSKIEIILAQKDRIQNIGNDLENISKLRDCLNHPAFGEISTLKKKFEDLRMVHNDQYAISEKLIADTQALLNTYHNLIRDTSKLFIYWNLRVSETTTSMSPPCDS